MPKAKNVIAATETKTNSVKKAKPSIEFTNDEQIVKELQTNEDVKEKSLPLPVSAKKEIEEVPQLHNTSNDIPEVPTKFQTSNNNNAPQKSKASPKAVSKTFKKEMPPAAGLYPSYVVAVAVLIKHNAEIRRFTSLGIINYLLQKGEIRGDNRYVSFKWNKFTVKTGNLSKEYSYSEPFFVNCLVASFTSFSNSAQQIIDKFCNIELNKTINEAVDTEEIDRLVYETESKA